jgi:hypothetical protein
MRIAWGLPRSALLGSSILRQRNSSLEYDVYLALRREIGSTGIAISIVIADQIDECPSRSPEPKAAQ